MKSRRHPKSKYDLNGPHPKRFKEAYNGSILDTVK